jgi:outer membrane protein assembly factor BamB
LKYLNAWLGTAGACPLYAGLVAAGVLIAAGSAARADDWPVYQHDLQHTGRSASPLDARGLRLSWSAPQGYSTPIIVGNNVIAMRNGQGTGAPSTVASFRLSDGAVNWTYTGNFTFPSQPAYADGVIAFVGSTVNGGNLHVLDANTGALRYTYPYGGFVQMPTLATPAGGGDPVAYLDTGSGMTAVRLGPTSATTLWAKPTSSGGDSIPTIVGNSVVVSGPGQTYALDQATGAVNHFHQGNVSGGGGDTVAFDAARNQFYVLDYYDTSNPSTLTAYHYTDNSNITEVWRKTGAGIATGGGVAIGPDGTVYSVDGISLTGRDPVTGNVTRSLTGQHFANAVAPALTRDYLFAYDDGHTYAYDLSTLTLAKTLPGSRGSLNSAFDSPGAFDDTHFILDYGTIAGSPGFDVYVVPEPTAGLVLLAGGVLALARRPRRTAGG